MTLFFHILVLLLLDLKPTLAADAVLIDYETLTHEIVLKKLRAGNHDESGSNEYTFKITLHGVPVDKEESKQELKDRKKVSVPAGQFGNVIVKNLSYWKDKEGVRFIINGDTLRELASSTMKQFEIIEDRVAILVVVEMFEKNTKFVFFGDDVPIGSTNYWAIFETVPHTPNKKNLNLTITDDQGTSVGLLVNYQIKKPKVERVIE